MPQIAANVTLTNSSPTYELDLSITDGSDREQSMEFTVVDPDSPSVILDRKLVNTNNYVPFVKSPLDLTQVSFNVSHGGVGLNDLSRFGKIKYTLIGATNGSTVKLTIGS